MAYHETFHRHILTDGYDLVVVGSLDTDLTLRVAAFPLPGETIAAHGSQNGPGGKGLNQAIAAARAGARTAMIGATGDDDRGRGLRVALMADGVDISRVGMLGDNATGLAMILLRDDGENQIVIDPAANAVLPDLAPADLPTARLVLASLEVPLSAVQSAFMLARAAGAFCILNAAPAVLGGAQLFDLADLIVVNETELAHYAACACETEADRVAAGRSLLGGDGQTIIVTLGGEGILIISWSTSQAYPAIVAEAIDTTGAGDCFCGVLAAGIAQALPLNIAVRRAIAAASLAIGKPGAAAAMPMKSAIDAHMMAING